MTRALATAFVACAAIGVTAEARANGRMPYATELVLEPGPADTIALRTTFGILRSSDHGASFRWICEQVAGGSEALDPGVAMFRGGALAVASYRGLAVGSPDACAFAMQSGELADRYVVDVTVDEATGTRAVAVTTPRDEAGAVRVFTSTDRGATWSPAGAALAGLVRATTLETAPSRFERVYVAGSTTSDDGRLRSTIVVSDDGGGSFRPGYVDPTAAALFVSAVDPTDPDRVYAVAYGAISDRLLVSRDGGGSFTTAMTFEGHVKGLALSPDGARVAVGGDADGIWVGDRATLAFARTSARPVMCLRWTTEALWACGTAQRDATMLARSTDEGATFTPVLAKLDDVAGPAECPADAPVTETCTTAEWAGVRARLGVTPPAPTPAIERPRANGGCGVAQSAKTGGIVLAFVAALVALARRSLPIGK